MIFFQATLYIHRSLVYSSKPTESTNAVLLDGQRMVPATLVSCIDPDLLENLVCLEEIEGCDDVDNVTDDNLEAWMKKSLGEEAKLTTTDDIASMVIRKIRTNMHEKVLAPALLKLGTEPVKTDNALGFLEC
jgi:hypothetical protein